MSQSDANAPKKRGIFAWYFESSLLWRIMIALVLGSVLGIILPQNATVGDTTWVSILTPFGDLFVRMLKMIMVPVIVCSLIIGTSSIDPAHLGKVGVKTIIFYAITTLFAIAIGLACGLIFSPGSGLELDAAKAVEKSANAPAMSQILLNIIPTNPFEAIVKGEILPIIAFCIFVGIGLAYCKSSDDERIARSAETVYAFFDGMSEIMFKVIRWVMQYAPIGVFALMFVVFNKAGIGAISSLLTVTIALYVGLAVQVFAIYCVVCMLIGINPAKFLKKVRAPMLTAFVTRSSNGTLPITMRTADEEMGIPKSIYGFVLPVGATVNMNGTTVYLGVCTLFIANACGIDLTAQNYFTIIITSMLAAIGTAGVPGAGALMLLLILESVGISVTGTVAVAYGMILGIDAILDMGRTSMNVTGDVVASLYVAKTEGKLDASKWEN
ncbi:dicarboxylate/amino acid:cation symporter [Campylobacter sp. JMF_08 NE1]|uniref:dicarboxylate/amino acid:cation symporter n=1 Tax=Campylobacter sp. JMF_08 NE1 TaxID=2983821 RepID=UPI0022E9C79A|nr:dicarboxylate/amino acid:cation symporter [Campylobacter sp. JMF_08 NE1]MDA3048572.1 dicarboxylate/amino acid:cation symporter [Campylobacter sp. JMF_08 NE1]